MNKEWEKEFTNLSEQWVHCVYSYTALKIQKDFITQLLDAQKASLKKEIFKLLEGINLTETDRAGYPYDENDVQGWWETSTGAEFGQQILDNIDKL